MPSYSFNTQRDIVVATMALHNYIRRTSLNDPAFLQFDQNPEFVPLDMFSTTHKSDEEFSTAQMDVLRDQIAFSLMRRKYIL